MLKYIFIEERRRFVKRLKKKIDKFMAVLGGHKRASSGVFA
jgi:hypothetical protein